MKKPSFQRTLVASLFLAIIALGLIFSTGLGTPSSFGYKQIAAICPLGALEVFLAEKTFIPIAFFGLIITVVIVLVVGKAFCAWLCPVPLTRKIFGGKKVDDKDRSDIAYTELIDTKDHVCTSCNSCKDTQHTVRKKLNFKANTFDSRFAVLIAALGTTFIFGFPIFCIVCPIGLSIATFIGIFRLFQLGETTLMLIAAPLILIVEIVLLKKWCHRFCPISALLSLISKGNKTFRPHVDTTKCIRIKDKMPCHLCYQACPEGIDLHDVLSGAPKNECTKCKECVAACPSGAIAIKLLASKDDLELKKSHNIKT